MVVLLFAAEPLPLADGEFGLVQFSCTKSDSHVNDRVTTFYERVHHHRTMPIVIDQHLNPVAPSDCYTHFNGIGMVPPTPH